MGNSLRCAKCGSAKLIPRARVIDRGDYSADVGSGVASSVFVEDPGSIYQAYVDSQQDR